jgi:hypothetical protein
MDVRGHPFEFTDFGGEYGQSFGSAEVSNDADNVL